MLVFFLGKFSKGGLSDSHDVKPQRFVKTPRYNNSCFTTEYQCTSLNNNGFYVYDINSSGGGGDTSAIIAAIEAQTTALLTPLNTLIAAILGPNQVPSIPRNVCSLLENTNAYLGVMDQDIGTIKTNTNAISTNTSNISVDTNVMKADTADIREKAATTATNTTAIKTATATTATTVGTISTTNSAIKTATDAIKVNTDSIKTSSATLPQIQDSLENIDTKMNNVDTTKVVQALLGSTVPGASSNIAVALGNLKIALIGGSSAPFAVPNSQDCVKYSLLGTTSATSPRNIFQALIGPGNEIDVDNNALRQLKNIREEVNAMHVNPVLPGVFVSGDGDFSPPFPKLDDLDLTKQWAQTMAPISENNHKTFGPVWSYFRNHAGPGEFDGSVCVSSSVLATINPEVANEDVLSTETTTDIQELTHFEQPAVVEDNKGPTLMRFDDTDTVKQGLLDFLHRPFKIANFKWNAQIARGANVLTLDPLRTLLGRLQIINKLEGFKYMRSDIKIKIQVTGTAFMGGKLRAIWIPPNRVGYYSTRVSPPMVTGNKFGVDIYPNPAGTYEFTIPCIIPRRMFYINDGLSWANMFVGGGDRNVSPDFTTLGLLRLYCLSKFISDDNVDYSSITVYAQLENVNLAEAYTPQTLQPMNHQLPTRFTDNSSDMQWGTSLVSQARAFARGPSTAINPEMDGGDSTLPNASDLGVSFTDNAPGSSIQQNAPGPSRALRSSNREGNMKGKGGILTNAAKWVRDVSRMLIPLPAPGGLFAGATWGIAMGLEKIFRFFDLDKPLDLVKTTTVINRWKDIAHSDGIDETRDIGLCINNEISPIGPNQPFDSAELHISSICKIPQLIGSRTVTTTTNSMDLIFAYPVAPWNVLGTSIQQVFSTGTTGIPNTAQMDVQNTFASYIGSCFQFWRGDLVLDLEVVAQAFSNCTIGITWVPGDGEADVVDFFPTGAMDTLFADVNTAAKTQIFRVSGNKKIRYVVPFVNPEYALNNDTSLLPNAASNSIPSASGYLSTNGILYVYLVNELSTFNLNGASINPIDLLFHTSWENLNFHKPIGYNMCNTENSAEFFSNPTAPTERINPENDVGLNPNFWFGERINNVLDLARRSGFVGTHKNTTTNNTAVYSIFSATPMNFPTVSPDNEVSNPDTAHPYLPAHPMGSSSFLLYLSRLFLTQRGKVTYTILGVGENLNGVARTSSESGGYILGNVSHRAGLRPITVDTADFLSIDDYPTSTYTSLISSGADYRPVNVPSQPATVCVPYYTPYTHYLTPDTVLGNDAQMRVLCYNTGGAPGVRIQSALAEGSYYYLYASAADCFSYGGLFPPGISHVMIAPGRPVTAMSWRA